MSAISFRDLTKQLFGRMMKSESNILASYVLHTKQVEF